MDLDEQIARIRAAQAQLDRNIEETRKFVAEARKLDAEQFRLRAKEAKLHRDRMLSPWLVAFGGVGGIVAMVALMLRAFNIIN
jgi:hypothetical protein